MVQVNTKCPECGHGNLIERRGTKGNFLGCSTYPECKYTQNIDKAILEELKQSKASSGSRFDTQSAYTSYAKDLLIAMMEKQPLVDIQEAAITATTIIGGMKASFKPVD